MASATPGYWILTATSSPVGSVRAVDLADRRRRQRPLVEAGERALERAAELLLGDGAQEREVHRRRRRLQRGERGAELLGHLVADEAQHLPELHERALHVAHRLGDRRGGLPPAIAVEAAAPLGRGEEAADARAEPARRQLRPQPAHARQAQHARPRHRSARPAPARGGHAADEQRRRDERDDGGEDESE